MVAKRNDGREHWPRGLREPRPGYYSFDFPNGGGNRAIGSVTEAEAIAACADMLDRFKQEKVAAKLLAEDAAFARMKDVCYYRARARAQQFGREVMSREEFEILWKRSGAKCELTGIAFSNKPTDSSERIWPWAASLDRIDNAKGYGFSNSRLVCVAMNMALHEFGEDVFRTLARCYSARRWDTKSEHEATA